MKAIVILDQIQAGLGGKERADTPLGGKKIPMGSADTTAKTLEKVNGQVIGTFYCGTDYYRNNQNLVSEKFTKMALKMETDVVILGPTYDYSEFSKMACELAEYFQEQTNLPVITAVANEKNEDLINRYRESLTIVKMPKKGDAGLSDSIKHLCDGCRMMADKVDLNQFIKDYCY